MSTTRRAFLIATGASGLLCAGVGRAAFERGPATLVIDQDLPQSFAFARRARLAGVRVAPLSCDVGRLWFDRLADEAAASVVIGVTRCADAFVLMQLGAGIGMHATRRELGEGAVWWTLARASASPRKAIR